MKRNLTIVLLLSLLPFLAHSQAPSSKKLDPAFRQTPTAVAPYRTLLNINNISIWVQNDGVIARDSIKGWGLIYPRGTAGLVYSENLLWVGKIYDGQSPLIRTGGGLYSAGTVPGVILQKGIQEDRASTRIFRFRKDYKTADLRQEAAEFFGKPHTQVTTEMILAVKDQYDKDLKDWPWQKGAPFKDINGNGVMDAEDYPDVQESDQVLWFAYNDLDESVNRAFYGGPSIGLEVQVTLWGYKDVPELENMLFKRYRLIYKGAASSTSAATIDSMFLSQWIDPDVGSFFDDLGGCDSALSMGFAFSATNPDKEFKQYGWLNPAVAYQIIQGPTVPGSAQDVGTFNFSERQGVRNLPMTAFLLNPTGDAIGEPRLGTATYWFWNVARGFHPFGNSSNSNLWFDPYGNATKFMYAGDPTLGTGWVDGLVKFWNFGSNRGGYSLAPGERRIILSTGPFKMALGDTQEIVLAILTAEGADGKQAVKILKYSAQLLKSAYPTIAEYAAAKRQRPISQVVDLPRDFLLSQNYPNPFNPSTRIEYSLPVERDVRLAIYNVLGQEVLVLDAGLRQAGKYSMEWDSRDAAGKLMPTGMYVYRLEAGSVDLKRKLIIIR